MKKQIAPELKVAMDKAMKFTMKKRFCKNYKSKFIT